MIVHMLPAHASNGQILGTAGAAHIPTATAQRRSRARCKRRGRRIMLDADAMRANSRADDGKSGTMPLLATTPYF